MTSLLMLSELSRSCYLLWTLLLCLVGVFSAVLAITHKRVAFAVLSLVPFVGNYFLWQVLFDLHLFGNGTDASAVSGKLGGLPWLCLFCTLLLLTAASLSILAAVFRCGKRSVTPNAIKHCLDRMPCGVCCWHDNGRVLFSNICMNRLCGAITGGPLLNGNQLCDAVKDGVMDVDGKKWRFSCRDIELDGERLHEMIASDVTAEYAKTQALEKDKTELSRLNRELEEYTLGIDDIVRRQEILQAKVNIHDEMNRLMLSTVTAESADAAALDDILLLWEQNALLLCLEAGETGDAKAVRVEKLAEALKIRLVVQGEPPASLSEEQRSLYYCAAQEAIANAAKHAHASTMTISFDEDDASVACAFTNDGRLPTGEVRFAGGLANLSLLAERQGARLTARTGEAFTLTLRFPKRGKNQPNG